jgi:hypothetical protein
MKPILILTLFVTPALAALPEPDTVFYGRILHLGGGEEHVVTSGTLQWRVTPPAPSTAAPVDISTDLSPLKGGQMSYQIRVPHHLQVAGTTLSVLPGLPVNTTVNAQPFRNARITVNGHPVRMADAAGINFDASALTRGSFRRLDLIVDGPLPDADNDGLPDWWEAKYHLDPNSANSTGDPDGDAVNNLAEYRAGNDPTGSDQQPRIPAEVLVSLPVAGRAIPVLRAVDTDSRPEQLTFTVGPLPAGITLARIGQTGLVSSFTQADLNEGRILLTHTAADPGELSLLLTLRDETPSHLPAQSTLRLSMASDETLWEGYGLPAAARPTSLPALQDGSHLAGGATLRAPHREGDVARLFIGSPSADTVLGSDKDDLISLRADDTAQGKGGDDRFLLAGAGGTVTIADFRPGDIIDLRGLLEPGHALAAYVQLTGTTLTVDANGDGSGYTDLTIQLPESTLPPDIADLWDSGALETGPIAPPTTLFLTSTGQPGEEHLRAATITLRRRGDATAPLDVPVTWSGTATLGRDYATVSAVAHFDAGVKTASFTIQPLADDEREPAETVQITLAGGLTTTLTIVDLPSRVWLEVAERTAYKDSLSPAHILVRRSGPMAAPLTAQLMITGRATAGLDYRRLPASLTFNAAQDVISLDVLPLASATLSRGAEDVVVDVRADAAYQFGRSPRARVMIVDRPKTLSDWRLAQNSTGDEAAFLAADLDGDGMNGLAEFAFGGNPAAAEPVDTRTEVLRDAAGRIGIQFRRWPGAPELTWTLEQSTNLRAWATVPADQCDEAECEILTNGQERVKLFLREPPTTSSGMLRIRVSRQE